MEGSTLSNIKKRVFVMVEKHQMVGWMSGTDIENDPTSTKAQMEKWASEGANRRIVELLKPPPSKHMTLDGDDLRPMTDEEVSDYLKKKKDDKDKIEADLKDTRKSAAKKLKTAAGLSSKELQLLIGDSGE